MWETRVRSLGREDPWRRKWQPTPVLLPGKSHGLRSLVRYSPWGRKESDTTEPLHFHFKKSRTEDGLAKPFSSTLGKKKKIQMLSFYPYLSHRSGFQGTVHYPNTAHCLACSSTSQTTTSWDSPFQVGLSPFLHTSCDYPSAANIIQKKKDNRLTI